MMVVPPTRRALDDRTLADALRALAIDAVEEAKSGHPGASMGLADIAQVLWRTAVERRGQPHVSAVVASESSSPAGSPQ
jgi:transketolase N-terminal domain/subunit